MQEPCQLCGDHKASRDHPVFGRICAWCFDHVKWDEWHEGIDPVRQKE